MNKIQVGSAPSPNLKVVRSKIGSLDNAHYKPGGGKVKIESKKLDFKGAGSRIEAKNEKYTPKGGEKKVNVCTLCNCFRVYMVNRRTHFRHVFGASTIQCLRNWLS